MQETHIPDSQGVPIRGDEKLLAAVAHFAIFFLPILLPLVIWLMERNKTDFSEYVLFQSKQALIYQIAVWLTFFGIGLFAFIFTYLLVGMLFLPTFLMLYVLALGYGAYAGVQCLQGEAFHYYFIGEKLRELRI